jgi:hypothetical protein
LLANLLGACVAGSPVAAAILEGQPFEDLIKLGSSELVLNGLGVRAVLFFKGYVAGLYLSERSTTQLDVVKAPGPKRLRLRMLRNASSDNFIDALVPGIRKNVNATELVRLSERIAQMERTIRGIGNTGVGDVIDFDYLPDMGTTIAVNGVRKGTAIAGADFYDAVLGIFVGAYPVDERLRKSLLGLP